MSATSTEHRPVVTAAATRRGLLGHPLAFLVTAAVLLALFGTTFLADPARVAPTKDPAYYTWRTEALLSERPETLLHLDGAFEMFAGGYRVAIPIIGALLRQVPAMSPLTITVLLMVLMPVGIALLLGGFAYRRRPDPLIFHSVALVSGSLLLTPPFVGYLDNMLALFFLAGAIWFIGPATRSWAAGAGLLVLSLVVGFTHPTTLAVFFLALVAMAVARFLFNGFDLRAVLRADAAMLLWTGAAVALTLLIWRIGIWGEPASLGESALPPPYGTGFFLDRLLGWVDAMNPLLNAPLFVVGVVGLLASLRRRWVQDDLARVSIVWLAPLAGLFGFVGGLAYPYYRFFNTTLAWLLLVGLGAFFVLRFFADRARHGGLHRVAFAAVSLALIAVVAANFATGFRVSGWNRPQSGWLSEQARQDLEVLRFFLAGSAQPDRPVVFVIDDEPARPFQIWGFTKLSGNTSRYGLPRGQIDQGFVYLGSLENYLAEEPTLRGEATYDKLSRGLLAEIDEETPEAADPVVVVAEIFNERGANAAIASGAEPIEAAAGDVHALHDAGLHDGSGAVLDAPIPAQAAPSPLHLVRVVAGLFLLLVLPGALALRWLLPDQALAPAVGMVVALSLAILVVVGVLVLAVARSPLSFPLAVAIVLTSLVVPAVLSARRPALISEPQPQPARP